MDKLAMKIKTTAHTNVLHYFTQKGVRYLRGEGKILICIN